MALSSCVSCTKHGDPQSETNPSTAPMSGKKDTHAHSHKPCGDCAKAQWKPIAECKPHENVVMADAGKIRIYGRFDDQANVLDSGGRTLQFVYHPVIFLDIPEEVFPIDVEDQPVT